MLFQTTRDHGKLLVDTAARDGSGMIGNVVANPVSKLQIIVEGNDMYIIVELCLSFFYDHEFSFVLYHYHCLVLISFVTGCVVILLGYSQVICK